MEKRKTFSQESDVLNRLSSRLNTAVPLEITQIVTYSARMTAMWAVQLKTRSDVHVFCHVHVTLWGLFLVRVENSRSVHFTNLPLNRKQGQGHQIKKGQLPLLCVLNHAVYATGQRWCFSQRWGKSAAAVTSVWTWYATNQILRRQGDILQDTELTCQQGSNLSEDMTQYH